MELLYARIDIATKLSRKEMVLDAAAMVMIGDTMSTDTWAAYTDGVQDYPRPERKYLR